MTHYETLGVKPTATLAEIKRAFRKLASQHHPDRGGDTVKAAAVNDAYAVLSDSERRARYDAGVGDQMPPSAEELARRAAHQVLTLAINAALDHPELERLGLIRILRDTLQGSERDLKSGSEKERAVALKLERLQGKLIRKTAAGDDVVALLIQSRIDTHHSKARQADEGRTQVTAALKMLEDYELEAEPAPQRSPYGNDVMRNPALFASLGGLGGWR